MKKVSSPTSPQSDTSAVVSLCSSPRMKFVPKDYTVIFEELMQHRESRLEFAKFLRSAHNEEPLLFLDALKSYRDSYNTVKSYFNSNQTEIEKKSSQNYQPVTRSLLELKYQLSGLVETFIKEGGHQQLNLPVLQVQQTLKVFTSITDIFSKKVHKEGRRESSAAPTTLESSIEIQEELSQLEKLVEALNPDNLFSKIERSISMDLKMDQFPRFSRSSQLEKFLVGKGEVFTRSIAIKNSLFSVDIRFKPNDLTSQLVTDKDIYFAFTLAEDTPDWDMIASFDKPFRCNAYVSKTSYLIGQNALAGMKLYKTEVILPFSLEDVWYSFCDTKSRYDFDKNLVDCELVKYVPPSRESAEKCKQSSDRILKGNVDETYEFSPENPPFALQYVVLGLDLKILFSKIREFPHTMTTIHDKEFGVIVNTGHTADFGELCPLKKDRVLSQSMFNFMFYRLSDKTTRVIHTMYSKMHTPMGDLLFTKVWKKRSKALQEGFKSILNRTTANGTRSVDLSSINDDLMYNKSLKDNEAMYPNRSWYREYQQQKRYSFKK